MSNTNPAATVPATIAAVTLFASVAVTQEPGNEWGTPLRTILAVFNTEEVAHAHATNPHAWNVREVEAVKCVMVDGVAYPLYNGFVPAA